MDVTIDCYGVTASLAGGHSLTVHVAACARVADVLVALAACRPELTGVLPRCACAIDDAVVPRTRALAAGERLALLPPVSGG